MSKRNALGPAIKAIREIKAQTDPAFTLSQFAPRCFMSAGHLSNVESGRRGAPEDVIHRIAAHLGVPVDAISYVTHTATQRGAAA